MTIFGNAWGRDNAPWRHITGNLSLYIRGGLGASRDILGRHLLQELLPTGLLNFFVCLKSFRE